MLKYVYIIIILFFHLLNVAQCVNEAWYSFQNSIVNENREELVITNVTATKVITLQSNVSKWKSITIGPVCYGVGLSDAGLEILMSSLNANKSEFIIEAHFVATTYKPRDIIIFHNRKNGKSEAIIVVSFHNQNELSWMSILNNKVNNNLWKWTLEDEIQHFNFVKMRTRTILFITTSSKGFFYEFSVNGDRPNKWFLQDIPLATPVISSAFNNFQEKYFLSLLRAKEDSVAIYEYSSKFRFYSELKSHKVTNIVSFNIGFKTFLSINGYNAGIYEFSKYGLIKQHIENSNLDGITHWLTVPVQTYRDDVLLFAQRRVDHGTHVNNEVDVFTYNGNKFEEHEDIPCYTFKESSTRLTCLSNNLGVLGLGFLVIEENVAVFATEPNNSILIYTVNMKLRQIPNPKENELHELVHMKKKLEILLQEQETKFKDKTKSISTVLPKIKIKSKARQKDPIVGEIQETKNLSVYLTEVKQLHTEILKLSDKVDDIIKNEKNTKFDTVIFNGKVKFEDEIIVEKVQVEHINSQNASIILTDIVRQDNIIRTLKNKTFSDTVVVQNLNCKMVNNIDAKNIAYKDENVIVLNGNVTFLQPVLIENVTLVNGNINGIHFETEAVMVGREHKGTLDFEEINVERNLRAAKINDINFRTIRTIRSTSDPNSTDKFDVHIPKNATVKFVNGENLTAFIESLCSINKKCFIPGTVKITEEIKASEIITNSLNNLKFPGEYLLNDSEPSVNISGRKTFMKLLQANIGLSTSHINNVDIDELITLSTDQHLGNKTFKHFGISDNGEIKIEGEIVGNLIGNFLKNPTLEEANEIQSNVVFKHLEVNGNIFIENNFNGQNYYRLLGRLIYQDDQNSTITALKHFTSGFKTNKLNIKSGSINKMNLSSIVTKDTSQNLTIDLLNTNIQIENLTIRGTYDGQNVSEIDQSILKLTGNQYVDSILTFDDLEVKNLEITEKLNDVSVNDFLFTTTGGRMSKSVTFDKIIVGDMVVNGNIKGNISGFDYNDLKENMLSSKKNQTFKSHFNINGSTVDHLAAKNINGNENDLLLNENDFTKSLRVALDNENLMVENLHIKESVNFTQVNNRPVASILPMNLTELANRTKEIIFENDIFAPAIEIGKLSFVNWNDYIKQIVYKNETQVVFSGTKTFLNGFNVDKLIETKRLNNVYLLQILRKDVDQSIRGPVEIEGDVTFEITELDKTLNGVSILDLSKTLFVSNKNYRVLDDMVFRRLTYIRSLKVHGRINDKDIAEVFKDVAYTSKDNVFRHDIIFKEPIFVAGNLAIRDRFNDFNFSDITSKIILITNDGTIDSLVTFNKIVLVQQKITVDENLIADLVGGFNTSDWKERSIPLDRGLLIGSYTFEHVVINENLITDFVNDIDMKSLVPLRTNQSIDHLEFKQLKFINDIPVGKTVNRFNLPHEVKRTLMANDDQQILPTTIFKGIILIRQNLNAALLNNQPTSKIITTNTNQKLISKFNFNSKCVLQSDINIKGTINGVNFDKWKNETVKLNSNHLQLICNDWILDNLTFAHDLTSFGNVSGLNLTEVSKDVRDRKDFKLQFEHGILNDYKGICKDVTFLYEKAKSQLYKFKYFEISQELTLSSNVKMVFYFNFKKSHYLLINKEECLTDLYVFNGTRFTPLFGNVSTGLFEQVVSVMDKEVLFLVTRGNKRSTCDIIEGVNIWIFNEEGLELKLNIEDQPILLQESIVPSTFYALGKEGVVEYKIKKQSDGPIKYRKWDVFDENAAFVPRGLKTGLTIRTGTKLIFLDQTDPVVDDLDPDTVSEAVIKGTIRSIENHYIPGRSEGDLAVLNVGIKSNRNHLLAVASHEETVVKGNLDFVKIYDDPVKGKLYDKVPTYRPSSLLSIEFEQAETLLAFLENKRILQIYEYKGIEGFEHRTSVKLQASTLFKMNLPVSDHSNMRQAIGVVHKNKIKILLAVMEGNRVTEELNCKL